MISPLTRRRMLALTGAALARPAIAQTRLKVAALFAGQIDDKGFMEAGYRGLVAAAETSGAEIAWKDKVAPQRDLLIAARRELAGSHPDLIIAHGGQNNEAARIVAGEFPNTR